MEEACEAAANMRYIDGMQAFQEQAFNSPPEEFVRLTAKQVFQGPMKNVKRDKFKHLSRVAVSMHGSVYLFR